MKKIKDITFSFFELLKYDRIFWDKIWYHLVFLKSPTIYEKYMLKSGADLETAFGFVFNLKRIDLDKLHFFWDEYKKSFLDVAFLEAGRIYRGSRTNFGFFFIIGFSFSTFNAVQTKKGTAILIDIWGLCGGNNGKKFSKILTLDEFAALFTQYNQRVL